MKTFLLLLLGATAAIIILANLGPMIILAVSLFITYYAVKKFILADSVVEKALWGFAILIVASMSLSNIPAFIGIASLVVLYYTYKKWKKDKQERYLDNELTNSDIEPWAN
ncbi:flagellar basal body rod protein [Aquibacillus halophilus]|uniref:Flagellar basal body rod protein n=1 Tax=Aquibacillus halophilus TaxID=930132 RepID=A0A6A8DJX8_9BACI|nr:flagellar basal body rod protein [Aquibacillus halophilus]MRH44059.1 flagellar basal body rod protein [Aquibacillus halophilus]